MLNNGSEYLVRNSLKGNMVRGSSLAWRTRWHAHGGGTLFNFLQIVSRTRCHEVAWSYPALSLQSSNSTCSHRVHAFEQWHIFISFSNHSTNGYEGVHTDPFLFMAMWCSFAKTWPCDTNVSSVRLTGPLNLAFTGPPKLSSRGQVRINTFYFLWPAMISGIILKLGTKAWWICAHAESFRHA